MRYWTSSILKLFAYCLLMIFASWSIHPSLLCGIILGLVFHFSLRPRLIYSHNLAIIAFVIFETYRGCPVYILPILSTVVYTTVTWDRKKILSYSKIFQARYTVVFFICIFILQVMIEFLTGICKSYYEIPVQILGMLLTISLSGIVRKFRT